MNTVVYHKTAQEAKRARRPKANETVLYLSIDDFNEELNNDYDNVEIICKPKNKRRKK